MKYQNRMAFHLITLKEQFVQFVYPLSCLFKSYDFFFCGTAWWHWCPSIKV